ADAGQRLELQRCCERRRARCHHPGAGDRADRAGEPDLDADRGLCGPAPASGAHHPAGGPVPRRLPGQPRLSGGRVPDRAVRAQSRYRAVAADGAGHAMVHPVQRDRRRLGHPARTARRGHQSAGEGPSVVAQDRAARRLPILCHRRHHGVGRLLERGHRRGSRDMGQPHAARPRARRLYRGRDPGGKLSSHRAGHRHDELLCRGGEPAVLAPALLVRRTALSSDVRCVMADELLLEARNVRRSFPRPGGGQLLVLDGVELTLKQGEIVGLLGRSGSGKSTFLRLVAGLAQPQGGTLSYLGQPIDGPPGGIAMVFQSFALFPWLTVLENVQLGLEALRIPAAEIRTRALAAIDLIGLDGYENAYPRELSGGMRQRVGFARAMVVHPNILLLDEPFSALDVLTAENLRTDLLELWGEGRLPIKGMILVTHNIEEAVLMCDRVCLFSTNPGRIAGEIKIDIPRPRDRTDPRFENYVDQIYTEMTAR